MLVVSAAYLSWLGELVPYNKFIDALDRTIKQLDILAPLTRIMGINADILKTAKSKVELKRHEFLSGSGPHSVASSFST